MFKFGQKTMKNVISNQSNMIYSELFNFFTDAVANKITIKLFINRFFYVVALVY